MVSTFTTGKMHLEKPAAGDYVDAWAPPINANFDNTDTSVSGTTSVTITSADISLTEAQRRNLHINCSGALSANRQLIWPNAAGGLAGGVWVVTNGCTNNFTLTAIVNGGTGAVIPQGRRIIVFSDGTNMYGADDWIAIALGSVTSDPNGVTSGNAGSTARPITDITWDRTNKKLYMAAGGTVWTQVTGLPAIFTPQGYLSPSGSVPIINADVTSTSVFYHPIRGPLVPIWDGSTKFDNFIIGLLQCDLVASHLANTIYDLYVTVDAGTIRLVTSPAWTASGAGAGNRGAGAGTAELELLGGIYVNKVDQTVRYGASTFTMPARRGTLVGSVWIDSAAGQTTCHVSYGQNRKFGLFNVYDQRPIILLAGDSTASWDYPTNVIRASNNNSANKASIFRGLPSGSAEADFTQTLALTRDSNSDVHLQIGIGLNSTTAFSGVLGQHRASLNASPFSLLRATPSARWSDSITNIGIGINDIQCCERTVERFGNSLSSLYLGTSEGMMLRLKY
jgi:hypothetical protein